jgi:ABC-type phosphate/phosphonate transport system substrate-binding protein
LGVLLLLTAPTLARETAPPDYAIFGVIPVRGPVSLHATLLPFVNAINQGLTRKLQLQVSPTYDQFLDDAMAERFDYAFPPPHLVELMVHEYGYRIVARSVNETRTVMLTRAASRIDTVAELEGRTVLFPSRLASVSVDGRRILMDAGLMDGQDVTIQHLVSHDHVLIALLEGQGSAGITTDIQLLSLAEGLRQSLKIIATGRPIPILVILANRRVSEAELLRFRTTLVDRNLSEIEGDRGIYAISGGFAAPKTPAPPAPPAIVQ